MKKKDGTLRICLDARKINRIIEDICEKPTAVEEAIRQFLNKKWLSTIDLTKGFYQIKLKKESRRLTAFIIGVGNINLRECPST